MYIICCMCLTSTYYCYYYDYYYCYHFVVDCLLLSPLLLWFCYYCCAFVTNTLHPVALYLLPLMNWVLLLLLLPPPSTSIPTLLLPFEVFLWSCLVAAANDDDYIYANEYDLQQHPMPQCLLNSEIKFVVSTSSIDVLKSPLLSVS